MRSFANLHMCFSIRVTLISMSLCVIACMLLGLYRQLYRQKKNKTSRHIEHLGGFSEKGWGLLENRQSGGGQGACVDVLRVRGSVQGRFWGTAVDLRQSMLEKLDGGQNLWRQKSSKKKKKFMKRKGPSLGLHHQDNGSPAGKAASHPWTSWCSRPPAFSWLWGSSCRAYWGRGTSSPSPPCRWSKRRHRREKLSDMDRSRPRKWPVAIPQPAGYLRADSHSAPPKYTESTRESDRTQIGGRKEPKHRRTPAYQHTPNLTHKQACVTASKIRPEAPGCLFLLHRGSQLHEPRHPSRDENFIPPLRKRGCGNRSTSETHFFWITSPTWTQPRAVLLWISIHSWLAANVNKARCFRLKRTWLLGDCAHASSDL